MKSKPFTPFIICCLLLCNRAVIGQPAGYDYVKEIVIHENQIPDGAALINFPFLFKVTDPEMRSTVNGGHVSSASGFDIVFYQNACSNPLDHQLESYNPATGDVTIWVRIPSLSTTSDTRIYVYYGNGGIGSSTSVNTVWDASYNAVWHLNNNPAGAAPQMTDGTANAHNGTAFGSMTAANLVAGKMGEAINFDEVNDYIRIPDFLYGQELTVSFWFNLSEVNGNSYQYAFSHGAWATQNSLNVYIGEDNITIPSEIHNRGMVKTVFRDSNDANNFDTLNAGTTWIDGNWHYYTMRIQDFGGATIYVDGVQRAVYSVWGANTFDPATDIFLGGREDLNAGRFYGGIMDEVRISSVWRSSNWILTEFNNQNDPGAFFDIGIEGPGSAYCWPLPISILDFSARRSGNLVKLQWISDNTTEPARFTVERSADANSWQPIGTVSNAFHYTDSFPPKQSLFYRLRYTQDTYMYTSMIKKVEYEENKGSVHIYPNPSVNGIFYLEFSGNKMPVQVTLLNTAGLTIQQVPLTRSDNGTYTMAFAKALAKGIYFLRFDFRHGSEIKKILIQ